MTTIEEVNKKIEKLEDDIEEIKREIGLVEGKDMLASLYATREHLYTQQTALLEQTDKPDNNNYNQELTRHDYHWSHSASIQSNLVIPIFSFRQKFISKAGYR